MKTKLQTAVMVTIVALFSYCAPIALSQWGGTTSTPLTHTHRSTDGTGPIRSDIDLSVLYPSSTSTVKAYISSLTGDIHSSGSLYISGSTGSMTVSNVFATDVYILQSVWASGSFYASGTVDAATGTFDNMTEVLTSGNVVAAGNITASTGTVTASAGDFTTLTVQDITATNSLAVTVSGSTVFDVDSSGNVNSDAVGDFTGGLTTAGNATVTGNMTAASGSFSGDVDIAKTDPNLTLTDTAATPTAANLTKIASSSALLLTNDIYMTGVLGNAVQQTGVTQYLSSADFTETATGSWSISVWTKCSPQNGSYDCAVTFADAAATNSKGIAIGGAATNYVRGFWLDASGTQRYSNCDVTAGWTNTEYHNIVFTHTVTTDAITLDMDNASYACSAPALAGFGTIASDSLMVNSYDGAINSLSAYYNDLRVYTRVLDATDKTDLYMGGAGTESEAGNLGTNLVAHYSFNNALTDSVGGYTLVQNAGGTTYSATGNIPSSMDIFTSSDGTVAGERGWLEVGDSYGKTTLQGAPIMINTFGALSFDNTSTEGRVSVGKVNVYDTDIGGASFTTAFGVAVDYAVCSLAATTTTGVGCTVYATDTTGIYYKLTAPAVGLIYYNAVGRD